MVVTKLFIDSLNVEYFPKLEEKENKSLNRFDAYLKQYNVNGSETIGFLRNIQRLRSTKAAHLGKVEKKVSKYFNFEESSYGFILGSIYATLVQILDDLIYVANHIAGQNKYCH